MLKALLSRSILSIVGLLALAIAAMLGVIALAYGLYGLLRLDLGPAAAAGITALAAALLAGLLGLIVLRLAPSAPVPASAPSRGRAPVDPDLMRQVVGVGAVLASLVADVTMNHRLERGRDKRRHRGGDRKRR